MNTDFFTQEEFGSVGRYLWFDRGDCRFALPIGDLVEVRELPWTSPLPLTLSALTGFTQLRDQIIPVLDPLNLAGKDSRSTGAQPLAAVCGSVKKLDFAVIVDRVGRVTELPTVHESVPGTAFPRAFAGKFLIKNEPELLVLDAAGIRGVLSQSANTQSLPAHS